jgi:hypothetical protein
MRECKSQEENVPADGKVSEGTWLEGKHGCTGVGMQEARVGKQIDIA